MKINGDVCAVLHIIFIICMVLLLYCRMLAYAISIVTEDDLLTRQFD